MNDPKSVDIIGCGIVGLVTALTIKNLLPDCVINMYDADSHPQGPDELTGTTFGKGRDARQFTGSESLSFQNYVHSRALRLAPGENKKWAGWRLIPENELTESERRWRSDSANRFVEIGHENLNRYDDLHAQLNYAGMMSWDLIKERVSYIDDFRLSNGPVSVYFLNEKNFEDDLESETRFLKQFGYSDKQVVVESDADRLSFKSEMIYNKLLQLPGSTWRIKSLGFKIITDLERRGVKFHWNQEITESHLLHADTVIWTVGTTHKVPDIYKKHSLIQGIAGCWVSIPNTGFTKPFKISVEQPSGYINITPDGNVLHISGGFGWVGERSYQESYELMGPIGDHFKDQINKYFRIRKSDMNIEGRYPVSICIRPSSPTGLPDARVILEKEKRHIILTGSGKSGSIQAPLLALFAVSEIDTRVFDQYVINSKIIDAVNLLKSLYRIHEFGKSTEYPAILERDLFGERE